MARYRHSDSDASLDIFRADRGRLYSDGTPDENAEALLDDVDGDLYVVGDRSAATLLSVGARPELLVVDGKTQRDDAVELEPEGYDTVEAANPQGVVSDEAYHAVEQGMDSSPTCVAIEGEEDLLAMPVIEHAETGSYLAYGDPGIDGEDGIRLLEIDDKLKDEVDSLLDD